MPARILAFITANFLFWPTLIVVPMSFSSAASLQFPPPGYWLGYYQAFFTSPNWTGPLFNSLTIALMTTVMTLILATPAAFALVRLSFFGKRAFRLLTLMPLLVPHIVLALAYYIYFGEIGLLQTRLAVSLAHVCLTIPIAVLILTAALQSFDTNLERAAASLGANPLASFRTVTLPVMMPAFLVAAFFTFINSFDESVIGLFISGRDAATLPRQMFNSFSMDADPVIAAASSILFGAVLACVGAVAAARLVKSRFGASRSPV
ncbi:ABC transporter permease [Corticibacterium sp. UT-5YL-CI-8]|nr:ABC transporter permease [Tianweitania sp. UT-5YL-CI-8]